MNLDELQKNWDEFGKVDPLWAILTAPDRKGGRWDVSEFFHTGQEEIDALLSDLDVMHVAVRRGQALDFGCGVGRLTQAMAEHFDHVTGVDIAPSMLERARELNRFPARCSYVLNKSDDLACFSDSTFNLIYSNYTLQHMHPMYSKRYLAEFVRLLAPEGALVFQLPSAQLPAGTLKEGVKRTLPAPLLKLALQLYGHSKHGQPVMETHVIPELEVVQLLQLQGATVMSTRRNPHHDGRWISLIYYVSKGARVM